MNSYDKIYNLLVEVAPPGKRGGIRPGKPISPEDLKDMIDRLRTHTEKKKTAPKQRAFAFR